MKKHTIIRGLLLVMACASGSISLAMSRLRLVGINSDFSKMLDVKHKPSVRVTKIAGTAVDIPINPPVYGGAMQTLNAVLPVEVTLKYQDTEKTIEIERVTGSKSLPCFGASATTIGARIKAATGTHAEHSKVCVSLSETLVPQSPIKSGDFNGVVLFLRPDPDFDPVDKSTLPFTFGLSAWTSDQAPWTGKTLSSTGSIGGDTRSPSYMFGKPLTIFQGFGGLGGGQIPRAYHGSIGHIFNDTDDIVLISRQSSSPTLSKFNYSQMIPPRAVFPYALFWIPKIGSKDDLNIARHDGIRIALLHKKPKIQKPDYIFFTDIGEDLSTDFAVDIPQGFEDLQALIEQNMQQADEEAADILGTSAWQIDEGDYPGLSVANHYYIISTDGQDKKTYVQKCRIDTDVCDLPAPVETAGKTAFTSMGLPSYYNLIIKKNAEGEFGVEMYETTLRPPYKY